MVCGDLTVDLILIALTAIATPIGFAFVWNNYKVKKKTREYIENGKRYRIDPTA